MVAAKLVTDSLLKCQGHRTQTFLQTDPLTCSKVVPAQPSPEDGAVSPNPGLGPSQRGGHCQVVHASSLLPRTTWRSCGLLGSRRQLPVARSRLLRPRPGHRLLTGSPPGFLGDALGWWGPHIVKGARGASIPGQRQWGWWRWLGPLFAQAAPAGQSWRG